MKKILILIGLLVTQASVFFFEEVWTIAMVSKFHFIIAIVLTTCLFSFFSIATSWLCENTGLDKKIDDYIEKKKVSMSKTAEKAATAGFWIVCFQTAIVVSPSATAILMFVLGKKRPGTYSYDILFSLVSATIWCFIYSGGIIVFKKIFF